ncbi:hypothetical protein MBLNU230_g2525t1 [Neophaeotheca triangularis]
MAPLLSALATLLYAAATVAQSCLPEPIKGQELPALIDATTEDLVTGLENGLFTSVDLVEAYVARINQVNGTLHCVTELDPNAVARAQQADALRANGTVLSPLHGIPILIKNNIATGPEDSMNNTAGSYALLGATVSEPSTMVKKLRAAGAIVLGKTNLSQWANFRSSNSSNGWSAYGGQTYGAYYPLQDPSGSSSGSGVASSIGLALGALGTETSGSILSPAGLNNLVGIKPTVGLTSRHLVIPLSEHQDTIGPMTRTVKDAAYILQTIAGSDSNDNYTLASPFNNNSLPDYVGACDYSAFSGARIGIARNVLEVYSSFLAEPVLDAFYEAVSQIEAAGATIVDANFTAFEEYVNSSSPGVLGTDFVTNVAEYLAELDYNPYGIETLEELRNFTQSFPLEEYPDRDTSSWDDALDLGYNNTSPEFWSVYQQGLYFGGEGGILGALERTNTTAVLLPTDISAGIPALVGSPVLTVPLGFYPANTTVQTNSRGLVVEAPNIPFGISFLGDMWSEADLIGFAYAYEQRTLHRQEVSPYIVPNIELSDFVDGM